MIIRTGAIEVTNSTAETSLTPDRVPLFADLATDPVTIRLTAYVWTIGHPQLAFTIRVARYLMRGEKFTITRKADGDVLLSEIVVGPRPDEWPFRIGAEGWISSHSTGSRGLFFATGLHETDSAPAPLDLLVAWDTASASNRFRVNTLTIEAGSS